MGPMDTKSVMETQLIGFLLDYCPAAAPAFEGDSAVGFLAQYLNGDQKGAVGTGSSKINFQGNFYSCLKDISRKAAASEYCTPSFSLQNVQVQKIGCRSEETKDLAHALLLFAVQM